MKGASRLAHRAKRNRPFIFRNRALEFLIACLDGIGSQGLSHQGFPFGEAVIECGITGWFEDHVRLDCPP